MKRTTKTWLSVVLAAGIVWAQPLALLAQANDAEKAVDQTAAAPAVTTNSVTDETGVLSDGTNVSITTDENRPARKQRGPVVSIGSNATLAAGETADAVVAVGGSAKAFGRVQDAVVAVGGDAEASADVGDAVVAVGGSAIARGKVGDAVVAIAGNAEANGEVGDAVVAVMGDVKIGPNGIVGGDVVAVGGKVEVAEGAQIKGKIVEISAAQYPILAPLKGVADWFRHCLLKFRLLAPQAGWYWVVAGVFLLLYLLIALAIPRPVAACVNELTQRPATTFLLGLLMKLLLPLVIVVLAMTGIGVVVIPFVWAAVFIGGLIGKVALFEYLGGIIFRVFGVKVARPVLALLVGFVLITLLYMVPLVSFLIYALVGLWAIGVAVTAAFSGARKETPPRPASTPPGATGIPHMPAANFPAPLATDAPGATTASAATLSAPPAANVPEAFALQRANFWERMGAALLDVVVVGVLMALIHSMTPLRSMRPPPLGFLVALTYFAGMWAWKGTTIGGTVFNLKVVRLDGQPATFAVVLVRGLVSVLSVIVLFLGFLWMIWDRDKQTWHDKVAGTVVVRTARVMPLVCL